MDDGTTFERNTVKKRQTDADIDRQMDRGHIDTEQTLTDVYCVCLCVEGRWWW